MNTYKYREMKTGEYFFVECETLSQARYIARINFIKPYYYGQITDGNEIETLGYDTYTE